jgi:phosphate starvation-inducible protein PhoH
MSLLAAVHTRWSGDEALTELLPVASVTTGANVSADGDEPDRPYATIETQPSYARMYTTGGKYVEEAIRIVVYHDADSLDELEAIVAAIETTYDDVDFTIDTSNEAIRMRQSGQAQYMQDDAFRWYAVIDYIALNRKG